MILAYWTQISWVVLLGLVNNPIKTIIAIVGWIMSSPPLKHVHILIPGTCEYATLYGKKDFAAVVKNLEKMRVYWIIQEDPR